MRLDDEKFGEMSPYGVRMPSELKTKIKASAKENRHSMNAEIVRRLEKSFEDEEAQPWDKKDDNECPEDLMRQFVALHKKLDALQNSVNKKK